MIYPPAEGRFMNCITHSGNLIEDAKYYPAYEQKPSRATFTMSVKRQFSSGTDLYDYVAWDSAADYIAKGLEDGRFLKGCFTEVQGSTMMNPYVERDSGKERKHFQVVVGQCFSRRYENHGTDIQNASYSDQGYPEYGAEGYYPSDVGYEDSSYQDVQPSVNSYGRAGGTTNGYPPQGNRPTGNAAVSGRAAQPSGTSGERPQNGRPVGGPQSYGRYPQGNRSAGMQHARPGAPVNPPGNQGAPRGAGTGNGRPAGFIPASRGGR